MEQRVRYDLYYIENWSLLFDIRIILRTAVRRLPDSRRLLIRRRRPGTRRMGRDAARGCVLASLAGRALRSLGNRLLPARR